ncbi:VCBS repeat-containing protein [Streptomyces sp. NPDC018833]|uniref:VCBS repeat-containing protein n=1 Tax=Streptomyces sp. NPDC018833 TaxID=3365053 RepID=UPI0037B1419C
MPRRTGAGVAALVAAGLCVALLTVPWEDQDDAAPQRPAKASGSLDQNAAQKKARESGKRVEVSALASATSTTYALPDGSFELTSHAAPIRAKVDGQWKPIDTTLVRVHNGWAPKAAADPVIFHTGKSSTSTGTVKRASFTVSRAASSSHAQASGVNTSYSDLITFTSQGHELTMRWPGALPTPVVEGSRALYRGVFEGVDLLLTARDSGFSHVLIVHSPEAAANPALDTLSYQLSSSDLTFHLDPVTQVVTGKNGTGEEIAVSPTPYMWDSAGKPAVTEGADPEPVEPSAVPSPSYSEEPGEPLTDNPSTDPNGPGHPEEPVPATSTETSSAGTSAQYSNHSITSVTGPSPEEVFALPGLLGPQPDTHSAVGKAALTGQGSTSAELSVTPARSLLTAKDTVWPVFIDPSITGKTKNWTTVYQKHPTSSFYDGANYNSGTTEARVGYESTTNGLSRSFFRLGWTSSIEGATVTSATIRLRETYAWSCEPREMQVWHTGGISSSTTWNHQPARVTHIWTDSFANGYNSQCPDAYVDVGAKSIAQQAAEEGWTAFTMGLYATNESSSYSWKKFTAEGESAPKITIVYNRKPAEPTKLTMDPGPDCDTTSPYASVGKHDLTFAAHGYDPDPDDLKYLNFAVWQSGSSTRIYDGNRLVDSSGNASVTLDGADGTSTNFYNGKTYFWAVRAIDSTGAASTYAPPGLANCGFVYDSSAPNSPKVASITFPEDDGSGENWSDAKFGTAGAFTFSPDGSTDTVRYSYSFNSLAYDKSVSVSAGASATVTLKPPTAALNVLYVKAHDSAGNSSPTPTKYLFYVSPRDTGDAPGDLTGDAYPDLLAVDGAGNLRSYAGEMGDVNIHMPGAHDNGSLVEDGFWTGADGKPALISHATDWYPGDGINDLLARMPDGKLYLYPGDGYGGFEVGRRLEVLLPDGAPAPSSLTQLVAAEDVTGDGNPDAVALAGQQLWAFTGYTGASFSKAQLIGLSGWTSYDVIGVRDISGDGIADLLMRGPDTDRGLLLRKGKPTAGGGVDFTSFASATSGAGGAEVVYGTTGWGRAAFPMLQGTPDANGDAIPDFWAVTTGGALYFYPGKATTHGTRFTAGESGWAALKTLG